MIPLKKKSFLLHLLNRQGNVQMKKKVPRSRWWAWCYNCFIKPMILQRATKNHNLPQITNTLNQFYHFEACEDGQENLKIADLKNSKNSAPKKQKFNFTFHEEKRRPNELASCKDPLTSFYSTKSSLKGKAQKNYGSILRHSQSSFFGDGVQIPFTLTKRRSNSNDLFKASNQIDKSILGILNVWEKDAETETNRAKQRLRDIFHKKYITKLQQTTESQNEHNLASPPSRHVFYYENKNEMGKFQKGTSNDYPQQRKVKKSYRLIKPFQSRF